MPTIILQLDPERLSNPDADIRYLLADLLIEKLGGRLADDGYDYIRTRSVPLLSLFFQTDDAEKAVPRIISVLKSERILGNDLSRVPVAVEDGESLAVVHPANFDGAFLR